MQKLLYIILSVMLFFISKHAYADEASLREAIEKGNLQQVKKELKIMDANRVTIQNDLRFEAPLHIAARYGQTAIVEYLLKSKKANIEIRTERPKYMEMYRISSDIDGDEQTPLHFAAASGSIDTIELLLNTGADLRAMDSFGNTPLDYAFAYQNKLEIVQLLMKRGATISGGIPFELALRHQNDLKLILFLLEHGGIPEVSNYGTSLHTAAAYCRHEEVMDYLLKHGEDMYINKRDEFDGRTPLFYAMRTNNTKMLTMLLDAGADPNARDKKGNTILHHAEGIDTIQILLSHHANVNIKNDEGETILHRIALMRPLRDDDLIKFLIKNGADINARNNKGETPIMLATIPEDVPLNDITTSYTTTMNNSAIEVLLDSGANVTKKDFIYIDNNYKELSKVLGHPEESVYGEVYWRLKDALYKNDPLIK